MARKEVFNPRKFEESLANMNDRAPFTVWSGKIPDFDEQQFPPNWGHPWGGITTIYEAIYRMYDVIGGYEDLPEISDENYINYPYIVDITGDVVLPVSSENAVSFLRWLGTDPLSGGTTGLKDRHRE